MLRLFLVLFVSNLAHSLNARILDRGNGMNLNGLSSTIIKSQQIEDSQNSNHQGTFLPDNSAEKGDDAHFRLFYKSNSPGRSVKHEMEHRFYKNPNQQPKQQQDNFNPFFNMNSLQTPQLFSYSNIPSTYTNQNDLNTDKSTMLNLHYHDNSDSQNSNFNLNQLLQQQQLIKLQLQKQQKLEQEQRKNQLMKLMLANYNSQKQAQLNSKQNNGVQYKIVNLKFRIEPQQGSKQNLLIPKSLNFGKFQ